MDWWKFGMKSFVSDFEQHTPKQNPSEPLTPRRKLTSPQ
jgi:hypothetical protein